MKRIKAACITPTLCFFNHDKRFVDHAGSYLIAVAGAYEVDGTDDGEQDNETQVQYLMVGNLRIIKEFAVVDEFAEMVSQPLYVPTSVSRILNTRHLSSSPSSTVKRRWLMP